MDLIGSGASPDGSFADLPGFVFDTETTGVDVSEDRVVELGAACFSAGQPCSVRRMRLNPERPIPAAASAIHGIRDEQVRDKPTFAAIAARFVEYLYGRAQTQGGQAPWLAGYNATGFDVPLLNSELRRSGLSCQIDAAGVVDPMVFVRWHLRHLRSRKLESACAHYDIPLHKAHSALDDALATGTLLLRMVAEGLIPANVAEALREQARLRTLLQKEWEQWGYWLYRDRRDGQLRLGAGSLCGSYLGEVSPDYLASLVAKVADLPDNVRATFLAPSA